MKIITNFLLCIGKTLQLRTIATIALEDQSQLLVKLGIIARS
jgi:hypothetical protein